MRKAITAGSKQRESRKTSMEDVKAEVWDRQKQKEQARDMSHRHKLEKRLKTLPQDRNTHADQLRDLDIPGDKMALVSDVLEGKVVGRFISHIWFEDGQKVPYNGKIQKLRQRESKYKIAYWRSNKGETYEDCSVDYDMRICELAADIIFGDLTFL